MPLKKTLDQIERQIQTLVESGVGRLSSYPGFSVQLVHELVKAMDENLRQVDDRLEAPNHYTVMVPASAARELSNNRAAFEALAHALEEAGNDAGAVFPTAPTISILEDNELNPGEIKIAARLIYGTPSSTKDLTGSPEGKSTQVPPNAFLIIGGNQVYPLQESIINIGRRVDNHLVIDDPSVSRLHGQLRAIDGNFVLFDLGSTGGTYVNGQKIKSSVLYPGDVISLADVQLVYGQDAPRAFDETQGYTKPVPVDQKKTITIDRPSAEDNAD